MSLRSGDLIDTVLKRVSVDEFTPKTGTPEEVSVVGFYVTENSVGQDLYRFINNGVVEVRDVEVSPNPDLDNYYMVFVEMDRTPELIEQINKLLCDIENITEQMNWQVKTYLMDDYQDWCTLKDQNQGYIPTSPEAYVTKEVFDEGLAQLEQARLQEEADLQAQDNSQNILKFLENSSLLEAGITDGVLHMRGNTDVASLNIINFGEAQSVMSDLGISESAIGDSSSWEHRRFNAMLGEMKAVPISEYMVIFHPQLSEILVTQIC
jgi:hypothetical protein